MIGDPKTAAPRHDLPFLRHRSRSRSAVAVGDFLSGHSTNPHHSHAAPPAATPTLAAPAAPAAPPAAPPPSPPPAVKVSSSLDLDATSSPTVAPRPAAAPASPATSPARAPGAHGSAEPGPGRRIAAAGRVVEGGHRLLNVKTPTTTLTRVQSGIGALTVEAVVSSAVGDLRIGCAYDLASGATSTVQLAGGNRFAPPTSRRPVIFAQREEYEQLTVDLRQVAQLRRAVIYAFSDSGVELSWAGTLVTTTFGGGRVELPLDPLFAGKVAVLMSIVNVGGELWLRAEMETIAGTIRDAVRAYGFDRITWRDDRTPAD